MFVYKLGKIRLSNLYYVKLFTFEQSWIKNCNQKQQFNRQYENTIKQNTGSYLNTILLVTYRTKRANPHKWALILLQKCILPYQRVKRSISSLVSGKRTQRNINGLFGPATLSKLIKQDKFCVKFREYRTSIAITVVQNKYHDILL